MSRSAVEDLALVVVPGAIWGASFLFIAEGLDAMAPFGVTFVRLLIGFLTLAGVPAARRPLQRGDFWPMAALSVIWLAFPLSLFPFAEQRVSSAMAGMLNGSTAIFAAIVAGLLSRQWPERPVLTGLVVGVAGIVLMAIPSIDGQSSAAGIAMILAAVLSYGVAINLARPLQLRSGALPVVWRTLGLAALLTAPMGVPALLAAHWTPRALLAMLALGALGTAIANVIMTVATGRLGATRASATVFLIPVVALILGVAVRGERVEPLSIAGAAVCLAGAWLIRPRPPAAVAAVRAAAPRRLEPAGR
ncbi:MAG: DMT family transporter [Vicinamibacterales bacterium]